MTTISMTSAPVFTHEFTLVFGRDIPSGGYVSDESLKQYFEYVDGCLECYTLTHFQGVWQGTSEDSFSISVCGNDDDVKLLESLRLIAQLYKDTYKQDSVLFKATELTTSLFI